jgi:GNAT superfamily N-acetyltransferase
MRRTLPVGLELDDAKERIDLDEVHRFLSEESYWAEGRPREIQERLVREATRVVGLYDGDRQIGFCRAFTDGVSIAYLADVYVLPAYRGRGIGEELVREMIDNGPHASVKWLLHTSNAHTLYSRFGFEQPSYKVLERPSTRNASDSG